MKAGPVSKATRISVETSASANLDQVVRWLLECRGNPLRLEAHHLPSLGQSARLLLAVALTARRAVACAPWLPDDHGPGARLVSRPLRLAAHPHAGDHQMSLSGP